MEIAKIPDAFNTAENNNNRNEHKSNPHFENAASLFSETQEVHQSRIRQTAVAILDSTVLLLSMLTVTIYALFSDDIRISACDKSADDIFFSLSCVALSFFALEMIASFIFKPEYHWSFYFWLDLIATVSIIPDIGWAWEVIIGTNTSGGSNSSASQVNSAGQSSRAGTRAARVIKIVRLVRLMRIAKMYKHAKIAVKGNSSEQIGDDEKLVIPKESRVGRRLSDIIIKRVIILIMVILIITPLLDLNFYQNNTYSWDYGLFAIQGYDVRFSDNSTIQNYYIDTYINSSRPLIYAAFLNGTTLITSTNPNDLRTTEKYYSNTNDSVAIFDIRIDTRLDAELSICQTIFVCIVLISAAIFFTNDMNKFAIIPIEKMIIKVKKIASNPLQIAEEKDIDIYDMQDEEHSKTSFWACKKKKKEEVEYETTILENTFLKIGVLLALGFGEAGANIISMNIKNEGDVDPLIKGNKVAAIFGFCDIRNFTDATEELQEGVMVFVNEIAKIVHSAVDHYLGAANKNIGDAFLVVWKFDSDQVEEFSDPIIFKPSSKQVHYLGDLALTSFLKIMVKINKDPCILKYRSNAKLVKRMPGYQVKFGFGLHLGWAIEGAIGSNFKIDASYLSHHVNMSMNLEGLTKMYGVPLLMTDRMHSILSTAGQKFCRHVDTISLKAGRDVYRLYTSDAEFSLVMPGKSKDSTKDKMKNKRKTLRFRLIQGLIQSWEVLEGSEEIALLKKSFTEEFFVAYEAAMLEYLAGRWDSACVKFKNVLKIRTNDGPATSLIRFMQESNNIPPPNWKGIRDLS